MTDQALMVAVVQAEDVENATTALNQAGWGVTRLRSVGGFLGLGNVTLLIGLARAEIPRALATLAAHCHRRRVMVNAAMPAGELYAPVAVAPVEAEVGGASVFAVPVDYVLHLDQPGAAMPEGMRELEGNKLVLAIVPETLSGSLLTGLTATGRRATRISTTGGWLRRGNATLLIGVPASDLPGVVELIQAACRTDRAAPARATVFVLPVDQFIQV